MAILKAHWKFDESTGMDFVDSSGNVHSGAFSSAPDWVTGVSNNCAQLDGTKYGMVPSHSDFNFRINSPWFASFWFKTGESFGHVLRKFNGGVAFVQIGVNGSVYAQISTYPAGGGKIIETVGSYNDNDWHHAVIYYDGLNSAGSLKIYVDGSLSSLNTYDDQALTDDIDSLDSFNLSIGGIDGSGTFTGLLDDIQYYIGQLTLDNVSYLFNNPGESIPPPPPIPVIYLPINISTVTIPAILRWDVSGEWDSFKIQIFNEDVHEGTYIVIDNILAKEYLFNGDVLPWRYFSFMGVYSFKVATVLNGVQSEWSDAVFFTGKAILDPCIYDLIDADNILAAICISLFSDRRFSFQDGDAPTPDDRRGWWGDLTLPDPEDRTGSMLWLLSREKFITKKVITKATEYIQDALKWMIDDGVVESIDLDIKAAGPAELGISIFARKPNDKKLTKYYFAWQLEGQLVGVPNVIVS